MNNKIPSTNFSNPDEWKNYLYSLPAFKKFESKYRPEYEKLWKNRSLYPGTENKIINLIIGNAAATIGLDWDWINDGSYLFGFFEKGGNKKDMVIKVPYSFSFRSLHSSIITYMKNKLKKSADITAKKSIAVTEGFQSRMKVRISKEEKEKKLPEKSDDLKDIIAASVKKTKENIITYKIDENGKHIRMDVVNFNRVLKVITKVLSQFTSWIRGDIRMEKSVDYNDAVVTADEYYMVFFEKRGLTPYQVNGCINGHMDCMDIGINIIYGTVNSILKYEITDPVKIGKCRKYLIDILKMNLKKENP